MNKTIPAYNKTEYAFFPPILLGLILLGLLASLFIVEIQDGERWAVALAVVVCLVALLSFYSLRVKVLGSQLKIIYGIGLIRFSFPLDQLQKATIVSVPVMWGYGIRITLSGTLHRIHGRKAVKLEYLSDNGKKTVMIGTNDAETLHAALKSFVPTKSR